MSVEGSVGPAEVVSEDENDVGLLSSQDKASEENFKKKESDHEREKGIQRGLSVFEDWSRGEGSVN